jgi:dienelactone hydrolase
VGFLFEPDAPGIHPAIVMLHGCAGAYSKSGELNPRHEMWGEYLAQHGYLTLMLDSFSARGVAEVCTQRDAERRLNASDRVGDIEAALAFLRARPDVDPKRIGLLGWSQGGSTVLLAVTKASGNDAGFSAAVALYPGCSARAKNSDEFHPRAPLLVLIGASDDWTPAEPCKVLTDAVAARGEPMQTIIYPGTYHDFDNPGLKKKIVRTDVANGVRPGAGVTIAPNPAARQDAMREALGFFDRHVKSAH